MNALDAVSFRVAGGSDAPAMAACRLTDPQSGPADPRMAAYFDGRHHPQRALLTRTGFVALANGTVVGYTAGHLTTRLRCQGELQYLFVAPAYRRRKIATALVRLLAGWFTENSACKVCICVDLESPSAKPFYESLGAFPISPSRPYWYFWKDIGVLLTDDRTGSK